MKIKKYLLPFFSVVVVSLYPSIYLYLNNLDKLKIKDGIGITSIIFLTSTLLLISLILIENDEQKSALLVNTLVSIFLYFAFIEKIIVKVFPMFYYWHILLICIFILFHLFYIIQKIFSSDTAKKVNLILLTTFLGLSIYNTITNIPSIIRIANEDKKSKTENTLEHVDLSTTSEHQELPNVYYFIFDEYAGYDGIMRYCDYDNSEFYTALETRGFNTSKHSTGGTIDTYTEIPNLLNLEKVNTIEMTANEKKSNFVDPFLFQLMQSNGYAINLLDSTNYVFLDNSFSDYQLSDQFSSTFRSFTSYILQNTAIYPFFGHNEHDREIKKINEMFDYAAQSSTLQMSNLFTMGYFNFPHIPYIFDEYGNKTSNANRTNLSEPEPYLQQFKYANKKIIDLIDSIIKNDPDSIIILQSDHGYRLPTHLHHWYKIDKYNLEEEAFFERNILNAVYYKGDFFEITDLTGLDTLISVINNLLDINIPLYN